LQLLSLLSGAKGYSKCLDFFVREGLALDSLAVDRHVRRYLVRFMLHNVCLAELVDEIRAQGFNPRFVARALYEQGIHKPA
jgi:hypothetical protein